MHGNQFGRIKDEESKRTKKEGNQKQWKKGLPCDRSRHTAKH